MTNTENNHFHNFSISPDILDTLKLLGYHCPTEVQRQVLPVMLAGRHVVVKAPTGSGKTAAFAIPLCQEVDWQENRPQALVLEPTRELSVQVRDEMFMIGRKKRLKIPALFGGFPIEKQIQSLRQKSHMVVGTPGRLMDHLRRGSLDLSQVRWLVLDEADLMLDMGFLDEVKQMMCLLPKNCKFALFSATLKPEIQGLVDTYLQDPVLLLMEANQSQESAISQSLYTVDADDKYQSFLHILMQENPESCMIFCGTREMAAVLYQKLGRNRIGCGLLHGELDQRERLKTVEAFRRGEFLFLIATDVAARGVDFDQITQLIPYFGNKIIIAFHSPKPPRLCR